MSRLKLAITVSALAMAVAVLGSHSTGRLFPATPAAVFVSAVVITGCAYSDRIDGRKAGMYLLLLISVGIFHRLYVYGFPASMVGLDPDQYAIQVERVIEYGNTSAITFDFYDQAPLYILLGVIARLVFGASASVAFLFATVSLTVLTISGTFIFGRDLSSEPNNGAVIAGSLALCGATLVRYSFWPIAQTLAVCYWVVLVWGLSRYFVDRQPRHLAIVMFAAVVNAFTHKLAPLVFVMATFSILIIVIFKRGVSSRFKRVRPSPPLSDDSRLGAMLIFPIVAVIMMFLQWSEIVAYLPAIISRFVSLLSAGGVGGGNVYDPAAAVSPGTPTALLFVGKGYLFTMLAVGGIAWGLLVFRRHSDLRSLVLLGTTAGVVVLIFPAVVAPNSIAPTRVMFFASILVFSVIGAAAADLDLGPVGSITVRGVLALLVLSQAFALPALVDGPLQSRYYLDANEMEAKSWAEANIEQEVWTDNYLSHESTLPITATEPQRQFKTLDKRLVDGTLFQDRVEYVAQRDIRVYPWSARFGDRILTWPYNDRLRSEYSCLYSAGQTIICKDLSFSQ